jgi:lysophospholipid acyltransferase (LPLAT)-like uncharacterized protein
MFVELLFCVPVDWLRIISETIVSISTQIVGKLAKWEILQRNSNMTKNGPHLLYGLWHGLLQPVLYYVVSSDVLS